MAYKRALNTVINSYAKAQRERAIQDNIDKVEELNMEFEDRFEKIENILKDTRLIKFDPEKYYKKFYQKSPIEEYVPLVKESEKHIERRMGLIKENKLLEKLNPKRTAKRLDINKKTQIEKDRIELEYEKAEKENRAKYDKRVEKIANADLKHNNMIDKRKQDFYNNVDDEIYDVYENFQNHLIPQVDSMKYIGFGYENKCATVEIEFLIPDEDLDRIKGAKYIKSKWDVKTLYFTNAEFENLYESLVFNSILSVASKIWYYFENSIDEMIINGYVNKLNPAIGKKEDYYFVSTKLTKGDIPFDRLNMLDSKMFLDSKHTRYKLPLIDTKKIDVFEFNGKQMMDVIDEDIDGFDFENLTKELLENNGFDKVEVTQASGDYGADVIAIKDGIKYAIQCKKYSSKVGIKAIQEIIAAQSMYKCHVGVVLTNNYFTPSAMKLAESNGILLWDKDKLEELIDNAGFNKGLSKIEVDSDEDNDEYEDDEIE